MSRVGAAQTRNCSRYFYTHFLEGAFCNPAYPIIDRMTLFICINCTKMRSILFLISFTLRFLFLSGIMIKIYFRYSVPRAVRRGRRRGASRRHNPRGNTRRSTWRGRRGDSRRQLLLQRLPMERGSGSRVGGEWRRKMNDVIFS